MNIRNVIFMSAFLLSCVGCNSHKQVIQSNGKITSIECEDVWRSSNVLKLQVSDTNKVLIHNFTVRLQDIQCNEVVELIFVGEDIKFKYESAGYKKTALNYLKVNDKIIFDKNS